MREAAPLDGPGVSSLAVNDVEVERHAEAICMAELQRIANKFSCPPARPVTARTAKKKLSDERMPSVLLGRSNLYQVVQDVLGHHLSSVARSYQK